MIVQAGSRDPGIVGSPQATIEDGGFLRLRNQQIDPFDGPQ